MLVCHQSFYARLDIARETPYDTHFRYSADVDWCIRIMKKAAERGQLLAPIPCRHHILYGGGTDHPSPQRLTPRTV